MDIETAKQVSDSMDHWEVEESLISSPSPGHPEHGIPDLFIFSRGRQIANVDRCYQENKRSPLMEQRYGRLIAKAPEMLELILEVVETYENLTSDEFKLGGDKPIREKLEKFLSGIE